MCCRRWWSTWGDINPPAPDGGPYPLFHERGAVGGILRGLFGYNGNPSLLGMLAYGAYVAFVAALWRRSDALRARRSKAAA